MGNAPLLLTILAALLPWTLARTHPGHAHHIKEKHAQDHHSNWVVVTTVNYPTETMKLLAAAPGWKVVVVADLKTPKDWALDNVIMLDMDTQKSLGYSIGPLLPDNHYGRKNLGYLFAIEHGATTVYETDDDNELKFIRPPTLPSFSSMEYYVYNATGVCNPYKYFGLPEIWPRGYPLDQINAPDCDAFVRRDQNPLILQGLADLDPDVDAIFRLTQHMGVNFRPDLPAVVFPEGAMCPWNSQNTLFAKDALWGLLIPITTTFRVCDIWRSYWVQRLLWEIGGNVAFGPPTVNQFRNAHNLMRDFHDEIPLYELAGNLVALLNAWEPPAGADLPKLMVALAQKMANEKMWEQGDADLMAAWVQDLQTIGYKFPKLKKHNGDVSSGHVSGAPQSHSLTLERASTAASPAGGDDVIPPFVAPRTPLHWKRYDNIVAVVMFNKNYTGWFEVYKTLREAYEPIFGSLVFTGFPFRPSELPDEEHWVTCEGWEGNLQYSCFANAIESYPAPKDGGHLIIADDTLISHCQIQHFNASKVWFPRAVEAVQEDLNSWREQKQANKEGDEIWVFDEGFIRGMQDVFKQFAEGRTANKFAANIQKKLGDDVRLAHFGGDHTDALYIPARLSADFVLGAMAFREKGVMHEMAVPAIFGIICADASEFEAFRPLYYWGSEREEMQSKYEQFLIKDGLPGQAFMLHPFKLTWAEKDLQGAFWSWWTSGSCLEHSGRDGSWQGTHAITAKSVDAQSFDGSDPARKYYNLFWDDNGRLVQRHPGPGKR